MNYLLLFFFLASTAQALDIVPTPNGCDFYLRLEMARPCINYTNYLISYGYKYCSLFKEVKNTWEPELQTWITNTALCLQESLATYAATYADEDDENYCHGLEKAAFASHPECYTRHGFCNLNALQQMSVVYYLTNLDILLKPKPTLQQAIRLAVHCVSEKVQSCSVQ